MNPNRKKRMDAIERRLADLEDAVNGWGLDTPPEFSCQPDYRLEPDDDRVIREARTDPNNPDFTISSEGWRRISADVRGEGAPFIGLLPPDDVRERVRERSDVADALAASGEWTDALTNQREWLLKSQRYENSLRALLYWTRPEDGVRSDGFAADLHALIEGCLAGGTITVDGLQRDD